MHTMKGAEQHQCGSSMMTTGSFPVDTLGRLKQRSPSQAYHCAFCTRVFRTAQALGGHMNIHRRERACVSTTSTPPAASRQQLVPQLQLTPRLGYLTKQQQRSSSCNGGYGKLDLVVESATISDPLTWLFSQLPPPRRPPPPPPPVSRPFHRGLAVCKSPPGVRRHVCRIHTSPLAVQSHVLYTGMMQSRTRGLVTSELRITHDVVDHQALDHVESTLDLDLRL